MKFRGVFDSRCLYSALSLADSAPIAECGRLSGAAPRASFATPAGMCDVNGHLHFVQYNADSPTGAGYADARAELSWDIPPVKELRKKHSLARVGCRKQLLQPC
jgi:hypothetical protein